MHVEAEAPAGSTGANRAPVVRPRPGPCRSRRRAQVRSRRHSRRARARQRARDRGPRRRRRARAAAAARGRLRDHQPHHRHRRRGRAGRHRGAVRSRPRRWRLDAPLRCADAALEQQMMAAIDAAKEAGDTLGGSFEVIARNVPRRPRQLRAVGPQARWPPGAGADVDSGDQGRGDRRRRRRRPPARARRCTTRSSRIRQAPSGEPMVIAARPIAPAASKAASPTARSCASPAS